MKPILGYDADDQPLREGDSVTVLASPASSDTPTTAVVEGLSERNNVDDAVQRLRMTDNSVVYDVHCLRMETGIKH